MPRNAWLTPDALPADFVRRVLLVPDDPMWIAILIGALLSLCEAENHEQYGSVTPQEAADIWYDVLSEFLEGEICGTV